MRLLTCQYVMFKIGRAIRYGTRTVCRSQHITRSTGILTGPPKIMGESPKNAKYVTEDSRRSRSWTIFEQLEKEKKSSWTLYIFEKFMKQVYISQNFLFKELTCKKCPDLGSESTQGWQHVFDARITWELPIPYRTLGSNVVKHIKTGQKKSNPKKTDQTRHDQLLWLLPAPLPLRCTGTSTIQYTFVYTYTTKLQIYKDVHDISKKYK